MAVQIRNQTVWAKIYKMLEKALPWTYTGVYSHPEFKSHTTETGIVRPNAPTNPTYRPITPALANEKVLDAKNFKENTKRADILADRELTPAQVAHMSTWQNETPLGGRRFRWAINRGYIYDYEDNGYR